MARVYVLAWVRPRVVAPTGCAHTPRDAARDKYCESAQSVLKTGYLRGRLSRSKCVSDYEKLDIIYIYSIWDADISQWLV